VVTTGSLGTGLSEIGGSGIHMDGFLRNILQELMVNRADASANIQKACVPNAQSPDGLEELACLPRGTLPPVAARLVRGLGLAERVICDRTTIAGQCYILP
jgi:hypothetical protein